MRTKRRASPPSRRKPRAKPSRSTAPAPPRIPEDDGTRGSAIELATDRKLWRRGYWFDVEAANHVCDFFSLVCRHSQGEWAGQPIDLAPWQRRWLRRLFGWKRPDGTRRYRRTFAFIPRKNGKSLLASCISLYLLMFDGEMGPQVFAAAADRNQAGMVFDEARRMVEASPLLAERLYLTKASILHRESLGVFRALSGAPRGKHGTNIHGVVIDEVHEFRDREVYNALTTGSVARRQPLEIVITTAGDDRSTLCRSLYTYACGVRDGQIEDPHLLPLIFEALPKDDWTDEKVWAKANPNLGVSVKIEALREAFRKAEHDTAEATKFRRYHLNMWESTVQRWLPIDRWRDGRALPQGLDDPGRVWYAGLDLSSTVDLSAFVMVSQAEHTDDCPYDVVPFFWCPEEGIETRGRRDLVPYPEWKKSGHLVATPGATVDYEFIEAKIRELHERHQIREVAYDRWGAANLVQRLEKLGLTIAEFGQGYQSMSAPSKELERLVRGRLIRHGGHPVLDWMAGNAVVQLDAAGNIKPVKNKSTERIDGIVALVMAIARASVRAGRSVYEDRDGLEVFG